MTIHIFRYSQLIDTDRTLTIKAFAAASKLPVETIAKIALAAEKELGIISRYKCGAIETEIFRQQLNKAILKEKGTSLEDSVFDNCWNAMCTVKSEKLSKLHQIQLENKDCNIHIIGDTNKLQHEFIGKQIALLTEKPEIAYTLSFIECTSDREKLKELAKSIYPDSEIVLHYDKIGDSIDLLHKHYANEDAFLLQQDTTDKVDEGNSTDESNKSLDVVEDATVVMGELELSSNYDSVE
ncbi:hypothetical protein [Candidatus Tisiphia endosymbiont of Hybos culiciformis]|uniref:hypothetical protein n=1 Tax=Candidatus Tisiphia endosymbiont of Hybos culiciformis TaxID=3139331 RepID=UPI003CCB159D